MSNAQAGRTFRSGLGPGSADIICCVAPTGRFVALEVKRPTGRVSEAQTLWMAAVEKHGGGAVVVRSVLEALAAFGRLPS